MLNINLCNEYIYHVVLTECQTKYVEEPQTGRSVSKLEPSADFAGAKVSLPVRGAVHAKLIVDDLRAATAARIGASSSARVRKDVETTESAFVVLLCLCSPKALG
jgi:hypothetical protein